MQPSPEVFIVYGFGFLLLGVIALIQPYDPRSLPISKHFPYLSAFGLIHGSKEWFDAWLLMHRVEDPTIDFYNSIFLLVSFLPLLEFGRRAASMHVHSSVLNAFLSRWQLTYLAISALLGMFWLIFGLAPSTIAVGARYFVGFPGALLTALAFVRTNSGQSAFPLGGAFIAYAVFGGLVVEQSAQLPAWLVTKDDFIAAIGVPVQVFRTACALIAGVGIVLAVRSAARTTLSEAYNNADRVGQLVEGLENEVADRTSSLVAREQDLKETLEILQLAKEAGGIGTWVVDLASRRVTWDDTNIQLHGFPKGQDQGDFQGWANVIHTDDIERVTQEYEAALKGDAEFDTEYRVVQPSGAIRHLKGNAMVVRDETGKAVRVVGMNYDLTTLRQNEAELLRTQRIANQAQKMEGIGQLTGGIAHDFNNLLAVIHGNLELLQDEEEPDGDPGYGDRKDIILNTLAAAKRGGDLTKKMLAFARQSSLEPTLLDINSVVKETERWLSRTIPSNIEIETNLQSRCWQASLDPTSLQSAIVNTVVNARDAMPEGGKLTIETSNLRVDQSHIEDIEEDVPPGRYVMLAITDTGDGISPPDLHRVFDPFFTTKEIGFGTGLGLSMVQGFVKQSKGFVRIYSEVGVGTSIKMYFPVDDADTTMSAAPSAEFEAQEKAGDKQRILIVDDQVEILDILRRALGSKGYSVETATSGDQALEIYHKSGPYDLLVTDIVMPGKVQGPGLAKALRELDNGLPAIFMSGYASEATVHGNGLRVEDIRLMKPVSRAELLQAVEKALQTRQENTQTT